MYVFNSVSLFFLYCTFPSVSTDHYLDQESGYKETEVENTRTGDTI